MVVASLESFQGSISLRSLTATMDISLEHTKGHIVLVKSEIQNTEIAIRRRRCVK
jgi:hypothetical protein